MGVTPRGDHLRGAGHLPAHPADRGDQLGDGVLGDHGVIQHYRVQRTPTFPLTTPVSATMTRTASNTRFGRSQAANRRRQ
jgi:hypothetical protein